MKKMKILIVEDEAIIALQLIKRLGQMGYDICHSTGSGKDSIAIARTEMPDIIIMDISLMGEMDGIEAARQISAFCPARIIFATGHMDPELRERAMTLKPLGFLIKPVEILTIQSIIQTVATL